MTILMACPKCGADKRHDINYQIIDEDGYVVGYMVHCRSCEHVWAERLRN